MEHHACVTGFNRGIGREIAAALLREGVSVAGICRSPEEGRRAVAELRGEPGGGRIDFLVGDLSRPEQVRTLAADYAARFSRLDLLINNAGLFAGEKRVTQEGVELTFAVNCVAPYLLSRLLLELLVASAPSRIVNVTSEAQQRGRIDYALFAGRGGFSGWKAYSSSKLALTAVSAEMARRLESFNVHVYAVHPGFVPSSGFGRGLPPLMRGIFRLASLFPGAKSPAEGAEGPVFAALSAEVSDRTGIYLNGTTQAPLPPAAADAAQRERLWDFMADATGLPAELSPAPA